MSTSYVIETHAPGKTYKNVQALKNLDLKMHQNSIFGFLGPKNTIEERVNEMLELVDLADKADRPIRTFSGGEPTKTKRSARR